VKKGNGVTSSSALSGKRNARNLVLPFHFFCETCLQGNATRFDGLRRAELRAPIAIKPFPLYAESPQRQVVRVLFSLSAVLKLEE
jgi:hypothetical protein